MEKIIERHLHAQSPKPERGAGVFIRADLRFSHDYFTGMCAHLLHQAYGEPASLVDPQSIITFEDHLVLASESVPHIEQNLLPGIRHLVDGHERFSRRYPVRSVSGTLQRTCPVCQLWVISLAPTPKARQPNAPECGVCESVPMTTWPGKA